LFFSYLLQNHQCFVVCFQLRGPEPFCQLRVIRLLKSIPRIFPFFKRVLAKAYLTNTVFRDALPTNRQLFIEERQNQK
jgi:hypothetical protein